MSTEQISGEGQITIPAHIREQLGLLPGTTIELEVVGDTLQLRKVANDRGNLLIQYMRGTATSGLTTAEIMQITRTEE